jgi:hypothetical protein
MTHRLDVNNIIKKLRETGAIDSTSKVTDKMNGSTDGHTC